MTFFRQMQLKWNDYFWPVFFISSIFYMIPIWSIQYLPMVDLPEHAALLSIWKNFNNPSLDYQNILEINWFTPYLIPTAISRFFTIFMDVLPAVKLVLSLSIIGFPLSMISLLRHARGDRWLCLLGLPLSFGFGFYWGFFTYQCSLPIAALVVSTAFSFHLERTLKRGLIFFIMNMVLFFTHGITFLACNLSISVLFLHSIFRYKKFFYHCWPLLFSGLVTFVWYFTLQQQGNSVSNAIHWEFNPMFRLKEFPSLLMGVNPEFLSYATALLVIGLPFLSAKYPLKTTWPRATMFSISWVFFLLSPSYAMETAFVFHRLCSLTFPFYFLLFPITDNPLRIFLSRIFIILTTLFWSIILTLRFASFNAVAKDFNGILEALEPGHFLIDVVEKKNSDLQADSFLHFSGWYTTFKGGINSNSFFYIYKQVIRFKKFVNLNKLEQAWGHPHEKYYLFRQLSRPTALNLEFITKSGIWWLYKEKRNGTASHP